MVCSEMIQRLPTDAVTLRRYKLSEQGVLQIEADQIVFPKQLHTVILRELLDSPLGLGKLEIF